MTKVFVICHFRTPSGTTPHVNWERSIKLYYYSLFPNPILIKYYELAPETSSHIFTYLTCPFPGPQPLLALLQTPSLWWNRRLPSVKICQVFHSLLEPPWIFGLLDNLPQILFPIFLTELLLACLLLSQHHHLFLFLCLSACHESILIRIDSEGRWDRQMIYLEGILIPGQLG